MTKEDLTSLRLKLGLGDDEPCPSPEAFAFAYKITPKRGYHEIDDEDGAIGVYDKHCEIVTVVDADFNPHRDLPCAVCGQPMTPMRLKCRTCGAPIDVAHVFELTHSEPTDDLDDFAAGRRLLFVTDDGEASRFGELLDSSGIAYQLRHDDDDGFGHHGPALWVTEFDFGRAQTAIADRGTVGG